MPEDSQRPNGQPNPKMRVSDAEREQVVAMLHRSTEEGRLDLSEFNERSEAVYKAKTYGELQELLDDLPGNEITGGVVAETPSEKNVAHSDTKPLRLSPRLSSLNKRGEWSVPQQVKLNATFSDVNLDFRQADVAFREVNINVNARFCDIYLILPEKVDYAVDDLKVRASNLENKCENPALGGVRYNVTGTIVMCTLKIVRKAEKSSWWDW